METTTKELLIQKKQQLVGLEMQLQNADRPKKGGYNLFMTFLGIAIFVGGGAGIGNPLLVLVGLVLIIAGILRGLSRSRYNNNSQKNIDDLSYRIIGVKSTIIELENA